jgi:F-type H+-transporting ATPase subunit c
MDLTVWVKLAAFVGAGLAMGLGAAGSGIGEGYAAMKTCEGMGRQPGIANHLLRTMLIGQAIAESTGIYSLVVALLLIFRGFDNVHFTQIPAFISAGLCMGLGAMGPGLGLGLAAGHACEAIARNPETSSIMLRNMLIGQAVTESTGIYSLVVSLLLIFVV